MPQMVSSFDQTLVSVSGFSVFMPSGVPVWVVPQAQGEALRAGATNVPDPVVAAAELATEQAALAAADAAAQVAALAATAQFYTNNSA